MKQTPHFSEGKRKDIALVFSCPGRFEEKAKRPVSGVTGKNLRVLISFLYKKGFLKSDCNIYDFRITNASDNVFFQKKNGRTQEFDSVLNSERNLKRLHKELKDINGIVICFGDKAKNTVTKMLEKYDGTCSFKPIPIRHLSMLSVNQVKISSNIRNRTEKRLEILADEIINQAGGKIKQIPHIEQTYLNF